MKRAGLEKLCEFLILARSTTSNIYPGISFVCHKIFYFLFELAQSKKKRIVR